ncbi:MaoC family dehydratase [Calidifontibacillus erzurumensis]|uniref:MaoC family dehydratase n=1 Tax=Calidifontibacillus erzurumensis TaxID=2741433 RepID=A0A8J8KBY0_9BACI|nr:MaoC family dehydratase [Calidifontibacillus erzurumensis]NSL52434.1 MaoC family dehydratase [Calidifontibacillus erzurumensis]
MFNERMLLPIVIENLSEDVVRNYAWISGDKNGIHLDPIKAKKAGFPERIVHGMLSMACCSRLFLPWLNNHFFVSKFTTTFRNPLFVGDSFIISGQLLLEDENIVKISFTGKKQNGDLVVTGDAELKKVR